jgi:fructose-1,6-bisphosphatase/inositol monophosphatase family enzyme
MVHNNHAGSFYQNYPTSLVLDLAEISRTVNREMRHLMTQSRGRAFERVHMPRQRKSGLRIDLFAEDLFRKEIAKRYGRNVSVLGEESLTWAESLAENPIVVLLDVLDGSDLLELEIGEYCTAATAFNASDPGLVTILGSVVRLANGRVYAACDEWPDVFVAQDSGPTSRKLAWRPVSGPSQVRRLKESTVSVYAQKPEWFCPLTYSKRFIARVKEFANDPDSEFRIHTLGGNPIMAMLSDRQGHHGRGFDAVFEVHGQPPHDVVPGVYIAKRAGARFYEFGRGGQETTISELAEHLLEPQKYALRYVLAGTEALGRELLGLLDEEIDAEDVRQAMRAFPTTETPEMLTGETPARPR